MHRYNDYELLYMISEESEEALEIMVNKYSVLIHSRLKKFRIQNNYLDDYYQEGLIVLFEAIKKYKTDSPMSFTNFFDLLLQRRIMDLLRKNKKYFENNLLVEEVEVVEIYNANNTNNNEEKILKLIDKLSSFEQEVFKLKYKENLKASQIAKKLGADLKSVYGAHDRIRSKALKIK